MSAGVSPIGSRRDAARALAGELTFLGMGAFRDAFVDDAKRVVYKVARAENAFGDPVEAGDDDNRQEHANAIAARALGIRGVPRTYLWEVGGRAVVAMRFYPGHPDDMPFHAYEEASRYFESVGFLDNHNDNWRLTPGGQPRIIDMQCWLPREAPVR